MAISKDKKSAILERINSAAKTAKSLVFVKFNALAVMTDFALRRQLRQAGVGYFVAKKTLLRRALSGSGIAGELPDLPGEIALAYGDDPLVPAKEIYNFQKKYPDVLTIVGGVYDGVFAGADQMTTLAKIPSRETLLGQLVYVINSPVAGLVRALDQIAIKRHEGGAGN